MALLLPFLCNGRNPPVFSPFVRLVGGQFEHIPADIWFAFVRNPVRFDHFHRDENGGRRLRLNEIDAAMQPFGGAVAS
jgi:hypothetical protein